MNLGAPEKGGKFFYQLSDYQLPEKDSVPWSW
jgi:hypothetical protein